MTSNFFEQATLMLVADGFDDEWALQVLATLRKTNHLVFILALRSGPIKSQQNLQLLPDLTLESYFDKPFVPRGVILPDGTEHICRLHLDPRVTQFLQTMLQYKSQFIGLSAGASQNIIDLAECSIMENRLITINNHASLAQYLHTLSPATSSMVSHYESAPQF